MHTHRGLTRAGVRSSCGEPFSARFRIGLGAAIIAGAQIVLAQTTGPAHPLVSVGTIPLAGAAGGHSGTLLLDEVRGLLFINGMGNSNFIDVIDVSTNRAVQRICCLKQHVFGPNGMAYSPSTNSLFVTDGAGPPLRFNIGRAGDLQQRTLSDSGGVIAIDDTARRIYVGSGALVTAYSYEGKESFNVRLDVRVAAIRVESRGERLFAALWPAGDIVVLNKQTGAVLSVWRGAGGNQRAAIVLDEQTKRLFACSNDFEVVMFDMGTGRVQNRVDVPNGCDSLDFDAARNRLYAVGQGVVSSSSTDGRRTYQEGRGPAVTVLSADLAGLSVIGRVPAGDYSSAGAWSARADRFYLVVPGWHWQENEIRIYRNVS